MNETTMPGPYSVSLTAYEAIPDAEAKRFPYPVMVRPGERYRIGEYIEYAGKYATGDLVEIFAELHRRACFVLGAGSIYEVKAQQGLAGFPEMDPDMGMSMCWYCVPEYQGTATTSWASLMSPDLWREADDFNLSIGFRQTE